VSGYFGPAGIFSTDNPVSDQMQIEAEQGPESEWEEDLLDEDEYPETDILHGVCPECLFWEHLLYRAGDAKSLENSKKKLREKHGSERPECSGELEFG